MLTEEGPGTCTGFVADISFEDNCKYVAAEVGKLTGGKLDVLINNAGGSHASYPNSSISSIFIWFC